MVLVAVVTLIKNKVCHGSTPRPHPSPCLLLFALSLLLRVSEMASLIEGFFQVVDGRPFAPPDDSQTTTTSSPRNKKNYLTLFNSCVALGSLPKEVFVEADLRVYALGQDLEDKVIHVHGRFFTATTDGGDPYFHIDVIRFCTMTHMNPSVETTLDDLRTSVTLLGQVIPLAMVPENTADRFFMLGVLDYVRDQTQLFTIKFVSH